MNTLTNYVIGLYVWFGTLSGIADAGIVFKTVITNGTGPVPLPNQSVTVHYTGKLQNGEQFDSSRDRNEPFKFKLGAGEVIRGWDAGVSSMKVGERAELEISPEDAYGTEGMPPVIPPSATLIFDIELLAIDGVTSSVTNAFMASADATGSGANTPNPNEQGFQNEGFMSPDTRAGQAVVNLSQVLMPRRDQTSIWDQTNIRNTFSTTQDGNNQEPQQSNTGSSFRSSSSLSSFGDPFDTRNMQFSDLANANDRLDLNRAAHRSTGVSATSNRAPFTSAQINSLERMPIDAINLDGLPRRFRSSDGLNIQGPTGDTMGFITPDHTARRGMAMERSGFPVQRGTALSGLRKSMLQDPFETRFGRSDRPTARGIDVGRLTSSDNERFGPAMDTAFPAERVPSRATRAGASSTLSRAGSTFGRSQGSSSFSPSMMGPGSDIMRTGPDFLGPVSDISGMGPGLMGSEQGMMGVPRGMTGPEPGFAGTSQGMLGPMPGMIGLGPGMFGLGPGIGPGMSPVGGHPVDLPPFMRPSMSPFREDSRRIGFR